MLSPTQTSVGQFCWVDLAASDAARAKSFYGDVFGWTSREQSANGGVFTRFQHAGCDVGSLYQISRKHRDNGVPSHWTPYIRVDDVDLSARKAAACGGTVIIRPFVVAGVARIALVADATGAHLGLWETLTP